MTPYIIGGIVVRLVLALALGWRAFQNVGTRGGNGDMGLAQAGIAFLLLTSAYTMAGVL